MNLYGVTQMNHGADHLWIFSEEELATDIDNFFYDDNNDTIPNCDEIECWPIDGSNCGPGIIQRLYTDDDIRDFLTEPGLGPDADDPELVDLAEYYCEADYYDQWYYRSSTRSEMERLGISFQETQSHDSRYDEAEQMIRELQESGYAEFDYDNPFYGNNRNMRFSELCDLHEKVVKK